MLDFSVFPVFPLWLCEFFIFIYFGGSCMVNLTTHKDFKSLKRGDKFKYVLSVIGAVIVSLYLLIAGIMFPFLISQNNSPKAEAASVTYAGVSGSGSNKIPVFVTDMLSYNGDNFGTNPGAVSSLYGVYNDNLVLGLMNPTYGSLHYENSVFSTDSYYYIATYSSSAVESSRLCNAICYIDKVPVSDYDISSPFTVEYLSNVPAPSVISDFTLTYNFPFTSCDILTYHFSDYDFVVLTSHFTLSSDYNPVPYLSDFSSTDVVEDVGDVWTSVGSWLSATVNNVVSVFYVDGNLTFLGILALVALGISLFFLLMGLLEGFLHLRG